MVKRIKKRIPKKEDPAEGVVDEQAEADEEAAPVDLAAELSHMGEDDFTRRTAGAFSWIMGQRKLLIAGGVVVAAGIGAYLFSQHRSRSATEEAAAAFQAGAGPYVEAQRGGPDAKAGADKQGQIEKAAKEFEAAMNQYGDRRVAGLATLGLAGARFDLGQLDDAIKLYGQFLERADTDAFARSLALQGLAAAQEQKGDAAAAIETWKKVEGLDRDTYGLLAGSQVGRILEAQSKGSEARTHYERLQKEYATALDEPANRQVKAELERRIAALAPQG